MIALVVQPGYGVVQAITESAPLVALITAGGVVFLIVAAALFGGGYLLTCRIWPFRKCTRCIGLGRLHSPGGKAWRDCPKCEGTGRRLRIGRRVWNHAERTKRNAI